MGTDGKALGATRSSLRERTSNGGVEVVFKEDLRGADGVVAIDDSDVKPPLVATQRRARILENQCNSGVFERARAETG